jgi:guanylate kinase
MVHLNVHTTDGQEVFVKEGEQVSLSMPSQRENIDGMELFYADRSLDDAAATIDWQAPGVPFQRNTFEDAEQVQEVMFPFGNLAAIQPFTSIKVFEVPELQRTAPTAPECPRRPRFTMMEPTMESAQNRYKKRAKESQTEYEARLAELHERDMNVYTMNHTTYEKSMARFREDSTQYAADLAKYNVDLEGYKNSRTEFRTWFFENRDTVQSWLTTFEWSKTALDQRLVKAIRGTKKVEAYRQYLIQEAQLMGMNEYVPQIQNFELEEATDTLKKVAIAFVNCIRNGRKLCEKKVDMPIN